MSRNPDPKPVEPADLPGLPHAAISRWLASHLSDLHQGGDWTGEVISGGLSNITYRLTLQGGSVILRRPPLGPTLPRAHDMRREYRVLTALANAGFQVPRPLALCTDHSIAGADFYVMPEVHGVVLRSSADTDVLSPAQRSALTDDLVETLARLHEIDPSEAGLSDYGRPGGYSVRQLRTWSTQWERSRTRDLPDMDLLVTQLADRVPTDSRTTVVHGDYRLDNTIVEVGARPRVLAVLDWELSTLGDPLADLALMLTYWHDLGDAERESIPVAVGLTAKPGFGTSEQITERYAARTGSDLREFGVHRALASMKLAVILEGVHARYLGGRTVGAGYESAGSAVPVLVARALRLLNEAD